MLIIINSSNWRHMGDIFGSSLVRVDYPNKSDYPADTLKRIG